MTKPIQLQLIVALLAFFMTKLLYEGDPNQYNYSNVQRWRKYVPGGDIFALDKIIIPVNQGNSHWGCAVIYVQQKKIQFYDSMQVRGDHYLNALLRYMNDEWRHNHHGEDLPSLLEWSLVCTTLDTPTQDNGSDCGVYTCMFADLLSLDQPLLLNPEDMTQCRQRIALSILRGSAI